MSADGPYETLDDRFRTGHLSKSRKYRISIDPDYK